MEKVLDGYEVIPEQVTVKGVSGKLRVHKITTQHRPVKQ
jgi:hypothetical protein